MIRWLSIAVLIYMTLGIIWWGFLLHRKNQQIYDFQFSSTNNAEEIAVIQAERSRQTFMILGEGIVLGCSLLIGIYIINRSAYKEIQIAKQKNDFLLSVSHELKSPIAAIKLALQTLDRPKLPEQKVNQIVNSALQDSNRLESLIQNILLSANIDNQSLELYKTNVDLIEIVGQLISNYKFEDKVKIISNHPSLIFRADEYNIRQAIGNIIDNALKYNSSNDSISVSMEKDKNEIVCTIENKGLPISPSDRKHIFEKFYRGDNTHIRNKEGAGIGLYIAKEIIIAHQGDISVISEKGFNTFVIKLPQNV